ncbi:ornithine cyclodeaminase family protein [Burkholderia vietnamiensis]|uniref:ornithine cyclodeaminase family protein n=1 Tax=Burkholderia vietnamiensis TaxID=60552 RepID=UPI001D13F204|nr:ornithine cyclodeaminase family protein [Burkholderia vietnamiensis]UEC01792.1 ornithine cyclodeaminase family protein [Burkholderia vietnamiensis]
MIKVFNSSTLRQLLPMKALIKAVRSAFLANARKELNEAPRTTLPASKTLGYFAESSDGRETSVKIASVRRENRLAGIPSMNGLVLWFDEYGRPAAVINAETLTAMRTGAVSGVATDLLASDSANAIAIIGSGGQAFDQVRAMMAVRPISTIKAYSKRESDFGRFSGLVHQEFPHVKLELANSVEEAVRDVDIVCTATTATSALFESGMLAERVHVNSIGAFPHDVRELSHSVLANAEIVVVDNLDWARSEAGDIISALETGCITVNALTPLADALQRPVEDPRGLTVFKSVGLPIQDWAATKLLIETSRGRDDIPTISLD